VSDANNFLLCRLLPVFFRLVVIVAAAASAATAALDVAGLLSVFPMVLESPRRNFVCCGNKATSPEAKSTKGSLGASCWLDDGNSDDGDDCDDDDDDDDDDEDNGGVER
jgi:hypothetical protein